MPVLVIAEYHENTLTEASLKTLHAAKQFNQEIDVLLAGTDLSSLAKQATKIKTVRTVLSCTHPDLNHHLAEPMQALLTSIADEYDVFLMASSTSGKNIMPRLAAKLDVMQISDIIEIQAPDHFVRPIYAGNALMTVKSQDKKKVITVRTTAFPPVEADGGSASIKEIPFPETSFRSSFIRAELSKNDRPSLTEAKIVVSGGRALGSKEDFKKIEELADQLNAAIGASRAAVDAGYAPNDWQVGQTGKVVAPELYIAIGISGAIQHVAGMKDSKIIVAINKDEEAPIFQIATYGIVGDLFIILPELKKKLAKIGYSY